MPKLTPKLAERIKEPRLTAMVDLALDYATKGYAVFPLQPEGKKPLPGSRGFKDATTDAKQIKRQWRATPSANIGIATGASDLVVVDLDVKREADGIRSWHLRTADLGLPEPLVVHTPSGGVHLYYQTDPDAERIGISADEASGIDVRADGGYVVAPGSYTPDGFYFVDAGEPEVTSPGDLPSVGQLSVVDRNVLEAARPRRTPERTERHGVATTARPLGAAGQHAALARDLLVLANTRSGRRNDQLNRSVFALAQIVAGGGLSRDLIYDAVEEACKQNGLIEDDGYPSFRKTFDSAWPQGSG